MFVIIGYVVALGCIFGAYAIHGGNMQVILHAIPTEMMAIGGGAAPVATAAAGGAAGPIRTREDALRELGRIADFFRATEPHSPLAYTLEEAVRRGRMTLPELLAEIIPDEEARFGMLSRLGIRPESTQ